MDAVEKNNVLTCARCSYSWVPRKGQVPQRCPRCRSVKWNMPFLNLECKRCGYHWSSHNGSPKRCPKCGTHQWDVAPRSFTCKRCGNTWVGKGSNVPKRCPACSCREWDKDPADAVAVAAARHASHVSQDVVDVILEKYSDGFDCVSIAIHLGLPYSMVYDTVRSNNPNSQIKV